MARVFNPAVVLGALSFGMAVGYWSGFLAPADTARWILLMALAPLAWSLAPPAPLGLPRVLILTWFAWATVTLAWSFSPADSLLAWLRFSALGAVFATAAVLPRRSIEIILHCFAFGLVLNAVAAADQTFALHVLNVGEPLTGYFRNPNILAEAGLLASLAVVLLPGALGRWRFLLLPFTLAAMTGYTLPPASKAVFVGLAAAGATWLIGRGCRRQALVWVAGCAAAIAAAAWLDAGLGSFTYRLAIWHDLIAAFVPLGHGLGSLPAAFPAAADAAQGPVMTSARMVGVAYNDALQILSDTGLGGFLLIAAAAILWRSRHDVRLQTIFAAWLALGVVDYPLHTPALAFFGAAVAGGLCWRPSHVGVYAGDGRNEADGLAALAGIEREGVGGAAGRGIVSLFAGDPRGQRAPGGVGAGHAAVDRPVDAAPRPRPGAEQPGAAAETDRRPAGDGRRPGGARDGGTVRRAVPTFAGNRATS